MTTQQRKQRPNRIASTVLLVMTLLLATMTAYVLFQPIDPSNFESTTGTAWDTFSETNPGVADYLSREARLLAVGWLGFSLLAAAVTFGPLRRGDSWASRSLWLFPVVLFGAAAVFLASGDAALGGTYFVAGIASAVALVVVGRRTEEP